jgi:hypothetical protein
MRRIWLNQQQIFFRGEKCSENLASFSQQSRDPRRSVSPVGPFPTLCDVRLDSGIRTQVDAGQRASEFVGVHALACDRNSRLGWTPSTCPMNGGWIE